MPTPVASAFNGPAANRDATGSTVLPALKNARAATNSAAKAGVKRRGAGVAVGVIACRSAAEQSIGGGVRVEPMRGDIREDLFRGGTPFRIDQRSAQALSEDRPDLRLGAGEAGSIGRGRVLAGGSVPIQRRRGVPGRPPRSPRS